MSFYIFLDQLKVDTLNEIFKISYHTCKISSIKSTNKIMSYSIGKKPKSSYK